MKDEVVLTETAAHLLEPLRPYAKRITGSADRQSVEYIQSTWRSWLERADVDDSVTQKVFDSIGPDSVTRPQLRAIAQKADSPEGRLALLIAVLIWGRGKRNGRMRDHIVYALTNPRRDHVLEETAGLAGQGKIAEAYRAWTLPGLRAAFFTKWLWAASSGSAEPDRGGRRPLRREHCCLVLDARVCKSLGAFEWDSRVASGRRDRPARYAAYVRDVHQCARQLGHNTSAEDVEFILFWMNGDRDKLRSL